MRIIKTSKAESNTPVLTSITGYSSLRSEADEKKGPGLIEAFSEAWHEYYKQAGVAVVWGLTGILVLQWQGIQPKATPVFTNATALVQDTFYYDLGGTTCSCALTWDITKYWKAVLGANYVAAHASTMFWGYFFSRNVQWVLIYTVIAEILEELGLAFIGHWAWGNPFAGVEPRYNSLLNDIVLAFPFCLLCRHFVLATNAPGAWERPFSVYFAAVQFALFNVSMSLNNLFVRFGGLESAFLHPGYIINCLAHISFVCALAWAWSWPKSFTMQLVACTFLLWLPFFVTTAPHHFQREQVAALLSFGLVGLAICRMAPRENGTTLLFSMLVYVASIVLYVVFANDLAL